MSKQRENIGVLSDTHSRFLSADLLQALKKQFSSCKRIIHAGDVTRHAFLAELEAHGWQVIAVRGNMDVDADVLSLPPKRVFNVQGVRIGVWHGWGAPHGIRKKILNEFQPDPPEVIIYGHTHEPCDVRQDGVRFVNPGSPARPRRSGAPTIGLLSIAGQNVDFEILSI